jgi:hypothetical protein
VVGSKKAASCDGMRLLSLLPAFIERIIRYLWKASRYKRIVCSGRFLKPRNLLVIDETEGRRSGDERDA